MINIERATKTGGAVLLAASMLSGCWWAVTRADEVMRHADQVPALSAGHAAQETRLRDLEGDAARQARALEQIQVELRERDRQQMAVLREILTEVRSVR